MAKAPPIDSAVVDSLADLKSESGENLIVELVTLFLDSAPGRLMKITQAIHAGDATALQFEAHSLKSSAANLGAMQLSEICGILEAAGRDSKLSDAAAQAKALNVEFERVRTELETIRAQNRRLAAA